MGLKVLITETKNFYRIVKMNKRSTFPAKVKKHAQPEGLVNV